MPRLVKAHYGGGPVSGSLSIGAARVKPTFTDTFDRTAADVRARWTGSYGTTTFYDVVNGRLRVFPVPAWQGSIISSTTWDFSKTPVWVELTAIPATGGNSKMCMFYVSNDSGSVQMNWNMRPSAGNTVLAAEWSGNSVAVRSVPYDPVQHRWLRLRATATKILWETSPDCKAWVIQAFIDRPPFVDSPVKVGFQAGYWGTETDTASYIEYDNFCILP